MSGLFVSDARNKALPPLVGKSAATRLGTVPRNCPPIIISQDSLDEILEFSDLNPAVEVGGFLLGGYFQDRARNQDFIQITGYLEATQVQSGYRSLTFTHESWADLHQQIATRFPNDQVVGWHHTHPGFGIFLSRHDKFIHRHFFDQPWHVALVVDPRRGELGFFQWQENRIVNAGFLISKNS